MFKRIKEPSEKEKAFSDLVHRLEALHREPEFAALLAEKDPELHEVLEAGAFHLLL